MSKCLLLVQLHAPQLLFMPCLPFWPSRHPNSDPNQCVPIDAGIKVCFV